MIFVISMSCNNHKKKDFYTTNIEKLKNHNNIKKLKLNLYKKDEELCISSENIIKYSGKDEKILEKKLGLILQESIFSLRTNSYFSVQKTVDINTYEEVEKNLIYKDSKNVYYNATSRNSNYPFLILDLNSSQIKILNGGYIKDDKNIYSYGGLAIGKLNGVKADNFKVLKFKDILSNKIFYRGYSQNSIYWNDSKMSKEDIENMPVTIKVKDSLQNIFTRD